MLDWVWDFSTTPRDHPPFLTPIGNQGSSGHPQLPFDLATRWRFRPPPPWIQFFPTQLTELRDTLTCVLWCVRKHNVSVTGERPDEAAWSAVQRVPCAGAGVPRSWDAPPSRHADASGDLDGSELRTSSIVMRLRHVRTTRYYSAPAPSPSPRMGGGAESSKLQIWSSAPTREPSQSPL